MIVELYNILMEIYADKESIKIKNKSILVKFEPDFKNLEFESLCEIISFKSDERYAEFLNVIKNLLHIIFHVEEKVIFFASDLFFYLFYLII